MKTIFVTGVAGFIGSNFVNSLYRKYADYRIIVLDALTYAGDIENILPEVRNSQRFEFWYGDINNLDLVITVDTSVAHLAGAMGKPVWVMVYTPCDWRWGLHGSRSPWYPSMKLIRQPRPGDWWSVVERVEHELREFVQVNNRAH